MAMGKYGSVCTVPVKQSGHKAASADKKRKVKEGKR